MATTTAAVTLTSDLLSDNMSVTASTTLMKAGTTADGLDQIEHGYVEIATGDQYDLICSTPTASKASKLYVKNYSTDETYYVKIMIDAQDIGRLYAGDWMFIPADFHDANADVEITSINGTNKIEYALFHEGTTLTAS
mgnify:FL=1|jgi:hypothetical protein|tara:strand:+ start:593 stop:1006 length:414 start_codon:yes stop_codon:yes gene_type:complete